MQEVYDIPNADPLAHAKVILQDDLDPLCSFIISLPLDSDERALALRAILLLYTVTAGAKVPCQMQLESILPVMSNLNSLVNAGTGLGKTICMVLPVLLDPTSITLIISPLKLLQMNQVYPCQDISDCVTQVTEFAQFSVDVQCINSDTLDDIELWKVSFDIIDVLFI